MRTIATLIVCVMSLSVTWGQSQNTAQIQGTVQDASGAPVPGAQIKATQTDTGVQPCCQLRKRRRLCAAESAYRALSVGSD